MRSGNPILGPSCDGGSAPFARGGVHRAVDEKGARRGWCDPEQCINMRDASRLATSPSIT